VTQQFYRDGVDVGFAGIELHCGLQMLYGLLEVPLPFFDVAPERLDRLIALRLKDTCEHGARLRILMSVVQGERPVIDILRVGGVECKCFRKGGCSFKRLFGEVESMTKARHSLHILWVESDGKLESRDCAGRFASLKVCGTQICLRCGIRLSTYGSTFKTSASFAGKFAGYFCARRSNSGFATTALPLS
jgi:hypothetical protein